MKEPFLSRRKRPNQPNKLKLVCSFNGTFQFRQPSGKLRYTDGETRIVSVDRNIGFSSLKSRVSELISHCPVNNGVKSFSLKYQLPVVDDDAPPVLITSDDDVRCMIEEYEKLESLGKPTRLWIFACNDNGYVCGQRAVNGFSLNCVEAENLNDGSGVSCKNSNGFVRDTLNGDGFECRISTTRLLGGEFGCDKVKNLAMGVNGVRSGDDSLRKMVLKQQLLAKQSAKFWFFRGSSGLDGEQTEMEFKSENKKRDQLLVGLTSESEGPASHETTGLEFGGNPYRAIVLDDEFSNNQIQRSDNIGISPLKVSYSHTLNPRDGNPLVETNSCGQGLKNSSGLISLTSTGPTGSSWFDAVEQFQKLPYDTNMDFVPTSTSVQTRPVSNLDSENIKPCDLVKTRFAPLPCSDQLARGVYSTKSSFGGLHTGSYHNCGCTAANMINQRASPYHIRNYRNSLTEMGNHWNLSLEGRPWVRKFHPSLRSSSIISKQRQAMRLYHRSLWKPWPSYNGHTLEGIQRMMDSDLNNQTSLLDQPCGSKENFSDNGGHGVSQPQKQYPMQSHFAYSPFMGCQIFLPINVTKNSKSMNTWEDLLIVTTNVKHGVPCQALCNNLLEKESESMEPMESINTSSPPNNLGFRNGTEMGCNSKLASIESSVKSLVHQSNAHAVPGELISSVDLSVCNLSLSSSKEVEAPDDSSLTSSDVSESLLKPQSKTPDLMDEEQISSGLQIEMSNAVASNSSSQKVAKLEKVDQQKELMQRDHTSSLSLERKADIQKSHNCSMPKGSSPSDLAVFYADLARRELQNIKNSDLEYIKELGSGTYGTVFYGKWKGCDVAIKKLKPCCFTEGAPEQDRLVADFWKEAYILGQLHHPHIVALYGVVTNGPVTNFATVTEYMVNGSLKQVLRRKDRTIDRRKRLIIAMDAAFGMEYLHEKKIVHFDLKSHNLLVNMRDPWRPVCKVGDLGLSKIKQRTLVSGGVRGTLPWMAPELLNSKENMVTEKVDVYSFGIVMWELLTGDEPYGKMHTKEIIAGIIKGNLRPEIPNWCDPAWRSLMERCWSSDPDSRPAFSEIAKELRTMSAAMNIK